jgi:site-specific recombinase XerD
MNKTNYYEICNQKLKYLNYSDRTIKSYLFYIKQFLDNTKIPPTRLKSDDFQSYLDQYGFKSVSQQNQVINSIRFLYKFGLEKKYDKVSFKRPKSEKKLPVVIDGEYIKEQLSKIEKELKKLLKEKEKNVLKKYWLTLKITNTTTIKIVHILPRH